MIIQRQKWLNFRRIVIFDNHGSVQLELNDKPVGNQNIGAYIYALWVDEDYHRKGLATKLIRKAEELAKKNGYDRVFLEWSAFEATPETLQWYLRSEYKAQTEKVNAKVILLVKHLDHDEHKQ